MSLQTLVLFRKPPGRDWLHGAARHKPFRAVAEFTSGRYAAMGLISQPGLHHFGPGERKVEPGSVRINPGALSLASDVRSRLSWAAISLAPPIPPIPPIPPAAIIPPTPWIAMMLLRTHTGQLGELSTSLQAGHDGVQLAASVLIGPARHNLLVEVVGEDGHQTLSGVQAIREHSAVAHADVCHTTAHLTSGFGEALG